MTTRFEYYLYSIDKHTLYVGSHIFHQRYYESTFRLVKSCSKSGLGSFALATVLIVVPIAPLRWYSKPESKKTRKRSPLINAALCENSKLSSLPPIPIAAEMQETDAQVVRLIQPSKLSEILKTTLTGGLYIALLLASDGSLVAGANNPSKENTSNTELPENSWCSIGALIAGTCSVLEDRARNSHMGESTGDEYLLLDCTKGKVCVAKIGEFLACLVAEETVELGFLKAKMK